MRRAGRCGSEAGLGAEEGGGGLAVGLALGGLHDLAHEEAGELAAGPCRRRRGARSHSSGWAAMTSSTMRLEGAGVHRLEALGLGDARPGAVPGGDHLGQHRLGLGGGELAAGLHRHERGEVLGRQRLGAVDGEVVLDVGEHPAGVGTGRDGGDGQAVEAAVARRWRPRRRSASTPGGRGQRRAALGGQQRERGVDARDVLGASGSSGHEVGLGEVAVVVGVLLHAEGAGAARRPRPSGGSPGGRARRARAGRSGGAPRGRWPGRASAAS